MNRGIKWIAGIAGALLVNLLLLTVFGDNGLVELSRLRARQQALAEQNETLARENVSLYHTIDRLKHDPVYLESVARNELGMVGKNDLVIIRSTGAGQRN
jgi:cell division protein FtsB